MRKVPAPVHAHERRLQRLGQDAYRERILSNVARASAAIVVVAGLALTIAACGGSSGSHVAQLGTTSATKSGTSSGSNGSTELSRTLAFARCMRSHGVPNFPDPDAQGNFPQFTTGVSKRTSSSANDACKHLLSNGSTATPQQLQQKLAFGVKVAECLRAHGYPDFPDPTRLGPQSPPPGVNLNSPRFQAIETACEQKARKALGLP